MSTKYLFPAISLTPEPGNSNLKLILIMLGDVANDEGWSWYSHQKLSEKIGCHKSTIKRYLKVLESKGVVTIQRRKTDEKTNKSNLYHLDYSSLEEIFGVEPKEKGWVQPEPRDGSTVNPGGVQTELGMGSQRTTEPTIEPTIEPLSNKTLIVKNNFDKQDYKFAEWMYKLILVNFPTTKTPNYNSWSNQIRLMRENDGPVIDGKSTTLTLHQMALAFKHAQDSGFHAPNVRCPDKLRKHFPKLVFEIENPSTNAKSAARKEVSDKIMDITNTNW